MNPEKHRKSFHRQTARLYIQKMPSAKLSLVLTSALQPKIPQRIPEQSSVLSAVYLSAGTPVELYSFDEAYLQRLRGSDPATEAHFVSYFSHLLRIKLRTRMLPAHTIDDICQETFLRVLVAVRVKNDIHDANRLGPYVNSMCDNILREHWRSSARNQHVDLETVEVLDDRPDLEQAMLQEEDRRKIEAVLATLSERDRDCLRALFFEQRDKDEVCRLFGVTRDYLRVLLHRAKNSFRDHYKEKPLSRGSQQGAGKN
jgi:RNA polymerase sigma-70 factor (ECF subfamily)